MCIRDRLAPVRVDVNKEGANLIYGFIRFIIMKLINTMLNGNICTQKSVTRNYKQYLGSLHTASEDAVYTIKLYLDFHEKPSAGQGPAFNYIENVKKLNLKKFLIFFQIFHFFQ